MIPIANQVNKLLNKWSFNFVSHEKPMKVLYPLKNRGLVKVSGPEAAPFLQGLITNDMNHFETGAQSLYGMFLNNKGRILYDTLVHQWGTENDNTFMLECDRSIQHLLQQHLKVYKLRRAIKIEDVNKMYRLWVFITPPNFDEDCCETDMKHNLRLYKDPRLAELGHRLITTPDMSHVDVRQAVGKDIVIKNDEKEYLALRYTLGVSEGADDLFPGTCFPLEANCDYLHGVSFHKGCYIGQELTARVHHTGVVRKRIMPIQILDIKKEEDLQKDATIWALSEHGRTNLGKLKAHSGGFGLGLVRIKEALEAKSLNLGENTIQVIKPHWWPVEAPKEKLNVLKTGSGTTPGLGN